MKPTFMDLHCDTLMIMQQENCGLDNAPGHIDLDKLVSGGSMLQCFANFIPSHDCAEEYGIREDPWDFSGSRRSVLSGRRRVFRIACGPCAVWKSCERTLSAALSPPC